MQISTSFRRTSHARELLAALAALALAGCSSDSRSADANGLTAVQISANLAGTPIASLLVTVTGAGIPTPLLFNLTVANNMASGTLKVPAGLARTFLVQAFDSTGDITHDGSKTVDVHHGPNPPITISLVPRNGQQPIQIFMGDYSVVVTPASKSIQVGQTLQLTAVVTSPNGDHPAPDVAWATIDPSVATVDQNGLVTGQRGGQIQLMATYGGVGGTMNLIVIDASAPLNVVGPIYPPPGGVTFTPGSGILGRAGGKVNAYTGFDLTSTRYLAFGADATDMPALMFDAPTPTSPIAAASRMAIDMNCSNPPQGIICYSGATTIPLANGNFAPAQTRLLLTLTTFIGGTEAPAQLAGAQAVAPGIGGYAVINNAFTGADQFRAKLDFQASTDAGTTWGPAVDVYDAFPLRLQSVSSKLSFSGGFYYSL